MNLPPPPNRPSLERENPPAIIRKITREDVLWNRPVFKAPPLVVKLPPAPTLADLSSISLHELGS
jgi:hypothetical protein